MAEDRPDEIDLALQSEIIGGNVEQADSACVPTVNAAVTNDEAVQSTVDSKQSDQADASKPETQSDSEDSGCESDSSNGSDSSDSSDTELSDHDDENVNLESDSDTEIPRTRNEILEDAIPKFPSDLVLDSSTPVEAIGHIKAVGDRSVVISANSSARYRVLADGVALIIDNNGSDRLPLGVLYETFGPVDKPYYVVKFETEEEAEPFKSRVGESVSQVVSTSKYMLTNEFKSKGTDASNFNDEEVPIEEQEFSDDEQEMLAKSSKKRKKNKKPAEPRPQPAPAQPKPVGPPSHGAQPTFNMPMTPELMQQWQQFQQYQQYQQLQSQYQNQFQGQYQNQYQNQQLSNPQLQNPQYQQYQQYQQYPYQNQGSRPNQQFRPPPPPPPY